MLLYSIDEFSPYVQRSRVSADRRILSNPLLTLAEYRRPLYPQRTLRATLQADWLVPALSVVSWRQEAEIEAKKKDDSPFQSPPSGTPGISGRVPESPEHSESFLDSKRLVPTG